MNPRRPWERDGSDLDDSIDEDVDQEHDPDPMWDLGDFDDEDDFDDAGRWRVPRWVVIVAILIALALIISLAWPLVADLIDRNQDSGGFPTPGPI